MKGSRSFALSGIGINRVLLLAWNRWGIKVEQLIGDATDDYVGASLLNKSPQFIEIHLDRRFGALARVEAVELVQVSPLDRPARRTDPILLRCPT